MVETLLPSKADVIALSIGSIAGSLIVGCARANPSNRWDFGELTRAGRWVGSGSRLSSLGSGQVWFDDTLFSFLVILSRVVIYITMGIV